MIVSLVCSSVSASPGMSGMTARLPAAITIRSAVISSPPASRSLR